MKGLTTMFLLFASSVLAQTTPGSAQPPAAATQPQSPPMTKDQIESIRAELRAGKSELIAQNVSFTSDEAAKFWPIYKKYEAAAKTLNDKRFDLLTKYLD